MGCKDKGLGDRKTLILYVLLLVVVLSVMSRIDLPLP